MLTQNPLCLRAFLNGKCPGLTGYQPLAQQVSPCSQKCPHPSFLGIMVPGVLGVPPPEGVLPQAFVLLLSQP